MTIQNKFQSAYLLTPSLGLTEQHKRDYAHRLKEVRYAPTWIVGSGQGRLRVRPLDEDRRLASTASVRRMAESVPTTSRDLKRRTDRRYPTLPTCSVLFVDSRTTNEFAI